MKSASADWTAICETCGNAFSYPDFDCPKQPGKHTVVGKKYYHLGGAHIQNERERRLFQLSLNLKPDLEVRDKVTGMITREPGVLITLDPGGTYETNDPEEQYYLDHKLGMHFGESGKQAWDKVYLTKDQQLTKANAELDDTRRQIRENNILLEDVKKSKTGAANAVGVR
jgi:hypothetical protein